MGLDKESCSISANKGLHFKILQARMHKHSTLFINVNKYCTGHTLYYIIILEFVESDLYDSCIYKRFTLTLEKIGSNFA